MERARGAPALQFPRDVAGGALQGARAARGQSTKPKNAPNRDQDFTIEVSSGSRTASFPGGSVHRLIYPDIVFGAGKIVMQTLRLPIAPLVERGVDPTISAASRSCSTGGRAARCTSATSSYPIDGIEIEHARIRA